MDRPPIPDAIATGRVVAIGRNLDADRALHIGSVLADAGVPAFEVTLQGPGAIDAIAALRGTLGARILIGAGTVLDVAGAEAAIGAGAAFLVMPVTDPDVIGWAVERGVPVFPGALTPTEILAAWRAGASAVKLFPSSVGGAALLRELKGPFPDIPLVPTGGVTADNARPLLDAGAVAVGVGSWLAGAPDESTLRERARALMTAVRD
ncbi:MAG: bifunctional 4-hydroxy-2-oxoglutarate aldolase/2-dehydro-3-deoxy-phosphogluconate aldolase [Chloroflexi bacterium]|nr:bifunctional 4-hydroxy-2-oxoglutarate aldolase/2-dehydro-3-deoxy-phosphogluconate aldolase [Chloroflexota bacterium]